MKKKIKGFKIFQRSLKQAKLLKNKFSLSFTPDGPWTPYLRKMRTKYYKIKFI